MRDRESRLNEPGADGGMSAAGVVMRIQADYVYVAVGDRVLECRMRGKLKKAQIDVLVGDRVGLEEVNLAACTGTVAAVQPRRNRLEKPAIANVDQALVVMAARDPAITPVQLDRLLVLVLESRIEPIIVVNKADVMAPELWAMIEATYGGQFPLLRVSAKCGTGLAELLARLAGKTSVLCGPSGVGKSSLLNALQPGLELQTGDLSDWGRGTHTTRHVALHQVETGQEPGLVADTPGFSLTELYHVEPPDLAQYFPEFHPQLGQCRFADCLHDQEPDCAVRAAWDESSRYDSYLTILQDLMAGRPLHFATSSTKNEGGTKARTTAGGKRAAMLRIDAEAREANRRLTKQQMQRLRYDVPDEGGDEEA